MTKEVMRCVNGVVATGFGIVEAEAGRKNRLIGIQGGEFKYRQCQVVSICNADDPRHHLLLKRLEFF
jgi:hypothetical protein